MAALARRAIVRYRAILCVQDRIASLFRKLFAWVETRVLGHPGMVAGIPVGLAAAGFFTMIALFVR